MKNQPVPISCPFCSLPSEFYGHSSFKASLYICKNHGEDIKVIIRYLYEQNLIEFYKLFDHKNLYEIFIYPSENKMSLYHGYSEVVKDIPYDHSLTPENLFNKIKTYINFQ